MIEEITPDSPILIPESLIVHSEGELKRGLYYYVITAVGDNFSESVPSHILQVYAPYKENAISFEWKNVGVVEYRIYKGTVLGHYDGYVTTFIYKDNPGYIVDDGSWELNKNVCQ